MVLVSRVCSCDFGFLAYAVVGLCWAMFVMVGFVSARIVLEVASVVCSAFSLGRMLLLQITWDQKRCA